MGARVFVCAVVPSDVLPEFRQRAASHSVSWAKQGQNATSGHAVSVLGLRGRRVQRWKTRGCPLLCCWYSASVRPL